jgi:hypothetical protein
MIATLAITMPSRLALGEPKENMICASAVAAVERSINLPCNRKDSHCLASAIFLLRLQFDYLVSLFFIVLDFAPKHPRESEHSVKQHSDYAVE